MINPHLELLWLPVAAVCCVLLAIVLLYFATARGRGRDVLGGTE